jgi:hypothetical protein
VDLAKKKNAKMVTPDNVPKEVQHYRDEVNIVKYHITEMK